MQNSYEITHDEKQRIFEYTDGTNIAFIEYKMHGKSIVLLHTFVPEAMAGRGIAAALAAYAFSYAKSHDMPVIVRCPYIDNYVKKHPDLAIQLDKDFHFNN